MSLDKTTPAMEPSANYVARVLANANKTSNEQTAEQAVEAYDRIVLQITNSKFALEGEIRTIDNDLKHAETPEKVKAGLKKVVSVLYTNTMDFLNAIEENEASVARAESKINSLKAAKEVAQAKIDRLDYALGLLNAE
jgi:hypothetical protein